VFEFMSKENGFQVASAADSRWTGRRRGDEKTRNSFAEFVARSKQNNNGRAHLKKHHGGFGL
jgi:hypothetical protein